MQRIGTFHAWPVEVGDVNTGVVYSVDQEGNVTRREPPNRVQGIGRCPEWAWASVDAAVRSGDLEALWDVCDLVYWEEVTLVSGRVSWAP